jgi:hypothetical protein
MVRLTLHFQQAGVVTLNIPVQPRQGSYAAYAPAPDVVPPLAPPPTGPKTPGKAKTPGTPKSGKPKKASATPAV